MQPSDVDPDEPENKIPAGEKCCCALRYSTFPCFSKEISLMDVVSIHQKQQLLCASVEHFQEWNRKQQQQMRTLYEKVCELEKSIKSCNCGATPPKKLFPPDETNFVERTATLLRPPLCLSCHKYEGRLFEEKNSCFLSFRFCNICEEKLSLEQKIEIVTKWSQIHTKANGSIDIQSIL